MKRDAIPLGVAGAEGAMRPSISEGSREGGAFRVLMTTGDSVNEEAKSRKALRGEVTVLAWSLKAAEQTLILRISETVRDNHAWRAEWLGIRLQGSTTP